jgi:hypothetical protein
VRTAVLVSGVVLLGLAGTAAGYEAGVISWKPTSDNGAALPLAGVSPSAPPLPVKTPVPSDVPALKAADLTFRDHTFSVQPTGRPSVQLSIQTPRGWQLTRSPKTPGEVKFLDPLKERGVRVESGFAPTLSPADSRDQLIIGLEKSQPPENDVRIISKTDGEVPGPDGEPRAVSTLIYTFIPNKTLRYVIVRWIAAGGDGTATIEMSITGLPQDANGLAAVLTKATESVRATG